MTSLVSRDPSRPALVGLWPYTLTIVEPLTDPLSVPVLMVQTAGFHPWLEQHIKRVPFVENKVLVWTRYARTARPSSSHLAVLRLPEPEGTHLRLHAKQLVAT